MKDTNLSITAPLAIARVLTGRQVSVLGGRSTTGGEHRGDTEQAQGQLNMASDESAAME